MKFHESKRFSDEGKQKVALVDIDETICFYSGERRYDLSEPNQKNIEKINNLYDEGWKIVYWTARGSVSGKDYAHHTSKQLAEWGCKYHELVTGTSPNPKPHFDLLIDDKAKRIEEL
tara:strand:- start:5270 stop:5620 length:351 start_codon:yes stop_codon:yes gene_type:complete